MAVSPFLITFMFIPVSHEPLSCYFWSVLIFKEHILNPSSKNIFAGKCFKNSVDFYEILLRNIVFLFYRSRLNIYMLSVYEIFCFKFVLGDDCISIYKFSRQNCHLKYENFQKVGVCGNEICLSQLTCNLDLYLINLIRLNITDRIIVMFGNYYLQ